MESDPSNKRNNILKDPERLTEIVKLGLSSRGKDILLQQYVEAAAAELDCPICVISIILPHAQHFKAYTGLSGWLQEAQGTPNEWSFCTASVETKKPYIIADTLTHIKEHTNPLVKLDGIRSYAGVPLISANGAVLGNFCVMRYDPFDFSKHDLKRLADYAAKALAAIEAKAAFQSKS